MAKGREKAAGRGTAKPRPRARTLRRPEGEDAPAAPSPRAASAVMRLAAEVDALKAELAAARARLAELESRADIDPLLDILNRRGFERELVRALAYVKRYNTPAALIYLDLDGFKPVNDRHGHAAGDAVLRAIASALRSGVRASDVVARLGGDEFAALLWNLDDHQAAAKAAQLEAALASAAAAADAGVPVGASAGVAMLLPLDTPAGVLDRADRAMYVRKAERKVTR